MRAVSIRLYDSLRRDTVEFHPIHPGKASLYVCGPTVQSAPHVGHIRSALVYDLWWRWLEYRGFDVTLVRNVTDIDDKVLEKSQEEGIAWWQLAHRVENEFHRAAATLNIRLPHLQPRATGDIPAMVELIAALIERGHAYVAGDNSGDVYFDVSSWPSYGQLTRQQPEDMEPGDGSSPQKKSPHDFALWKGKKPQEPDTASWAAPWGPGRPGWHIECSAMATRYLGSEFDIHGGGLDLRFPHHENELAQATAAGHGFARHWVHNGLVLVDGQKMSKSLGNSVFATPWLESARPIVARYALTTAHYRSDLDLHRGFLEEATRAFSRIEGFLDRSSHLDPAPIPLPERFAEAMDNDLGTPEALAVIHDTVRAGNQALDDSDTAQAASHRGALVSMLDVLGLNPDSLEWAQTASSEASTDALERVIRSVLDRREQARADKDYALSDALRELVEQAGVTVEDGPDGSTWRIDG